MCRARSSTFWLCQSVVSRIVSSICRSLVHAFDRQPLFYERFLKTVISRYLFLSLAIAFAVSRNCTVSCPRVWQPGAEEVPRNSTSAMVLVMVFFGAGCSLSELTKSELLSKSS